MSISEGLMADLGAIPKTKFAAIDKENPKVDGVDKSEESTHAPEADRRELILIFKPS
jgi:hypothetical protein